LSLLLRQLPDVIAQGMSAGHILPLNLDSMAGSTLQNGTSATNLEDDDVSLRTTSTMPDEVARDAKVCGWSARYSV
jgi:hypothetical protein